MARFHISADGIKMAKAGKTVDSTDINDLTFSSEWPMLRVKYTGTVTVATYTGEFSNVYDKAEYYYPEPFSAPPIVMVAGVINETTSDQRSAVYTSPWVPGGYSSLAPYYCINSLAEKFELYVLTRLGSIGTPFPERLTSTYRYYVFDSLIEAT